MLAEQRQHYILDKLSHDGALSIGELVKQLQVSRETVRRDLNVLAARGLLQMTHGGALAAGHREADVASRLAENAEAKRLIGLRAAQLVPDGAALIIDSGSTTLALARALLERRRLTIHTNDLRIALLLGRRNDNRVNLLGGELADNEDATFGLDTLHQLSQYHADLAFIGAGGISPQGQLTDYTRGAAELRGCMIRAANVAVVLADHTKFGRTTPVRIAHFAQVRYVISERKPEAKLRKLLLAKGPQLLIAAP